MNEANAASNKTAHLLRSAKKLEKEFTAYCNAIGFHPQNESHASHDSKTDRSRRPGNGNLLELSACIAELLSVSAY